MGAGRSNLRSGGGGHRKCGCNGMYGQRMEIMWLVHIGLREWEQCNVGVTIHQYINISIDQSNRGYIFGRLPDFSCFNNKQ